MLMTFKLNCDVLSPTIDYLSKQKMYILYLFYNYREALVNNHLKRITTSTNNFPYSWISGVNKKGHWPSDLNISHSIT